MKVTLSIALVLPLLVIGCRDNGVQPGDDMVNFTGTVILESAQTYLIRSDVPYQKTVTTFYPLNLAACLLIVPVVAATSALTIPGR